MQEELRVSKLKIKDYEEERKKFKGEDKRITDKINSLEDKLKHE